MATKDSTFILYRYEPSLVAAIIFIVLFFNAAIGHTFLAWRYKARYFIAFIVGCLFEAVGYIGRAMGHYDNTKLTPYIMQSLLLLVAPILYAATLYMILGRLIRALDASSHSVIRLNWLTKIFVIGDVLCFFVQGGGAGILSSGNADKVSLGENIIVAGLALQIVLFAIFVVVAVIFHVRIVKVPTTLSKTMFWRKHMAVLYLASFLVLARNLVRVVEFAQGNDGYIIAHEIFLYLFDAVLMFGVTAVYLGVHPGVLLDTRKRSMTSDTESNALAGTMPLETREERHFPRKQ